VDPGGLERTIEQEAERERLVARGGAAGRRLESAQKFSRRRQREVPFDVDREAAHDIFTSANGGTAHHRLRAAATSAKSPRPCTTARGIQERRRPVSFVMTRRA
jgi:hypothetical protein